MFGSREIALGALTLLPPGEARTRLVQVGVAVDGADAFTGVAGARVRAVSKKAGLLLAAVAAGAVATGSRACAGLTAPLVPRVTRCHRRIAPSSPCQRP